MSFFRVSRAKGQIFWEKTQNTATEKGPRITLKNVPRISRIQCCFRHPARDQRFALHHLCPDPTGKRACSSLAQRNIDTARFPVGSGQRRWPQAVPGWIIREIRGPFSVALFLLASMMSFLFGCGSAVVSWL
jgi:hypothetical protein